MIADGADGQSHIYMQERTDLKALPTTSVIPEHCLKSKCMPKTMAKIFVF